MHSGSVNHGRRGEKPPLQRGARGTLPASGPEVCWRRVIGSVRGVPGRDPGPAAAPTAQNGESLLAAIDRDDAAAEAAWRGDLEGAARYFDYFGHEQEDMVRATLEYRLARQKLGDAVREPSATAPGGGPPAVLGVPRHWRGGEPAQRSVRRRLGRLRQGRRRG